MNSTTSTRKTTRPVRDRCATWAPQLAPSSVCDRSSAEAPVVWRIASATVSLSSPSSGSVCTRIASEPDVVTTGDDALSTPVPATAARRSSARSWLTSDDGRLTRNSAPPVNSMP